MHLATYQARKEKEKKKEKRERERERKKKPNDFETDAEGALPTPVCLTGAENTFARTAAPRPRTDRTGEPERT